MEPDGQVRGQGVVGWDAVVVEAFCVVVEGRVHEVVAVEAEGLRVCCWASEASVVLGRASFWG